MDIRTLNSYKLLNYAYENLYEFPREYISV